MNTPRIATSALGALALLALAASLWCALGWQRTRSDAEALKAQLQISQLALQDARQHLQATEIINRRLSQMIREQGQALPETPAAK
jgi:hypothetical protein